MWPDKSVSRLRRDVLLPFCTPTLNMEAACSAEISVTIYKTTQRHVPVDSKIFICLLDCETASEIIGYVSFRGSQSLASWVYVTRNGFCAVITSARGLHDDVIRQWSCFLYRNASQRNGRVALCLGWSWEQATAVLSRSELWSQCLMEGSCLFVPVYVSYP
jgi:hypothetical protein